MSEEKNKKRNGRPIKFLGIMLPSMPKLLIRFGGLFLRFKRDAKKAGRVFQKQLIKKGIDKKTAKILTDKYLEGSDLSSYMRNIWQ
jgi:hypothetical protein